jgi:hypothetical protein
MRTHHSWIVGAAILPFVAACSRDGDPGAVTAEQSGAGERLLHRAAASADGAPDAGTISCADPNLGTGYQGPPLTGPTASYVDLCESQGCVGDLFTVFSDRSQVALDYGDFPFKTNGLADGTYFYTVVEPGYEDQGFLDGAVGNLSDTTASSAPGDHGSGDTVADRTIVADGQPPAFFPRSTGTHPVSFPPAQFVAIQLVPFEVTPDGAYELSICPANATSACDCAFSSFFVRPKDTDAGAGGAAGDTGTGGASSGAGGASTSGAGGASTSGAGGASTSGAGGASTSGAGGASSAGSAGAPCLVDAGAGGAPQVESGAAGTTTSSDAGTACDGSVRK